jgi:hypothetical protein
MTNARLVLFLALCLVGCGDGDDGGNAPAEPRPLPVPGCEHIDHAACDVLDVECQERLLGLAACLRGNEPGELPPISVMTQQQYADYLNDYFRENPVPDPDHFEAALAMLGLVEPGALRPENRVTSAVTSILGVFRNDTDDILLIDGGERDPALSSRVLVHEYVHLFQDRELDLSAFRDAYQTSVDATLAVLAVIEGEARLHESRYLASLLGLNPADVDWRRHFQGSVDLSQEWLLEQPSAYVAEWNTFPYAWGARNAHFAWQASGTSGVRALYASPPLTSRALMESVSGIAPAEPGIAITPVESPAEWSPAGATTLGALNLFLVLSAIEPTVQTAHHLALAWRGDLLSVYGASSRASALVWRIEFGDAASARSVAGLFTGGIVDSTELRVQSQTLVIATASNGTPLDWAFPE